MSMQECTRLSYEKYFKLLLISFKPLDSCLMWGEVCLWSTHFVWCVREYRKVIQRCGGGWGKTSTQIWGSIAIIVIVCFLL